nr:MAG TPA: hypothetical protein [Caudoviricetes sp.]
MLLYDANRSFVISTGTTSLMYFSDIVHYLDALICFVLHLTFCTF